MSHLQKDISKNVVSAADLEQILQISAAQKGVSVLDVYSSEWGPCKAISETFRRLFTDAGDGVHLRFFTVECNAVLEALRTEDPSIARHMRPKNTEAIKETLPEFWAPILEKRRGKSKPFFVMYKEGRKIYEVEGVNTPLIRAYVKDLCTVKTPASEFITQQKLLEFWEEHFNPEESEVSLEKFMRVMTVVCKLAVSLAEEEKAVFYEAIGIRKESKEKIVTAENLQKWIGDDEGKTVPAAFAETCPEYEVRAAQARAEKEAEERKRQEQLRKEREEQERKEQEEREAEEAARKKAEEEAVAASFKTYELPDKNSLDSENPANAVARIDEETAAIMPQVKEHITRASAADDNAATWKFIQDTVADSANSLSQHTVESVPFISIAEANDQCSNIINELERVNPFYFRAVAEQYNVTPTRVACAALALSEKAGGVDAKASAIKCLTRALATCSAEDSAKLFGLDAAFVDFGDDLQKGASNFVSQQPSLAAYLLLSGAEQVEASSTFYAMLKPDELPEAGIEYVLPALSVLCSAAPENVPENRVCVAIQGLPRIIDLSSKNGQSVAASGWYYKGQVSSSDTASGFTSFVIAADQEVMGEDKLKELSKNWEANSRIPEDTFLRAFHHLCLLRQMRRDYASKIDDPFWIKFNERLPHRPRDAVRELFNSMDGDGNGGLTTYEVVSGISRALDIPYGDDITDAVEVAFAAVNNTRADAGKSWTGGDSSRVGVHELSLVIQCVRMYYELLAKVADRVLGSHSAKVLTPEDAQTSLGLDMTEDETNALFNEGNGKASFNEIASFAIKKNFDLAEDDDEGAAIDEASASNNNNDANADEEL